jgi:hypothetical protein
MNVSYPLHSLPQKPTFKQFLDGICIFESFDMKGFGDSGYVD